MIASENNHNAIRMRNARSAEESGNEVSLDRTPRRPLDLMEISGACCRCIDGDGRSHRGPPSNGLTRERTSTTMADADTDASIVPPPCNYVSGVPTTEGILIDEMGFRKFGIANQSLVEVGQSDGRLVRYPVCQPHKLAGTFAPEESNLSNAT